MRPISCHILVHYLEAQKFRFVAPMAEQVATPTRVCIVIIVKKQPSLVSLVSKMGKTTHTNFNIEDSPLA